jgi:hypothetical protein
MHSASDPITFKNEDERLDYLSKKVSEQIKQIYKGRKIASSHEQLRDIS